MCVQHIAFFDVVGTRQSFGAIDVAGGDCLDERSMLGHHIAGAGHERVGRTDDHSYLLLEKTVLLRKPPMAADLDNRLVKLEIGVGQLGPVVAA
jgi:hypothetical protein